MAVSVPNKPAGARYIVTMYDPALSPHDVLIGLVAGGTAPLPVMPNGCVCCDASTERRKSLHLGNDRYKVKPVELLVCDACQQHAFADTAAGFVIGMTAAILVSIAVIGISLGSALLAVSAGTLALGLIALSVARVRARNARALTGHHALTLRVSPGKTVLKSSNRHLVTAVVERNPASVRYVS